MWDILSNIVMGFVASFGAVLCFMVVIWLPSLLLADLAEKILRKIKHDRWYELDFWKGMLIGFLMEIPLLILFYLIGRMVW